MCSPIEPQAARLPCMRMSTISLLRCLFRVGFLLVVGSDVALCKDEVREAIGAGLALVQKAARSYPDHRDCFSCHHQTLPMLAVVTARDRGFSIDEDLIRDQAEFTRAFYHDRVEIMNKGEGVGGRGMTAGYALWAFDLAGKEPDETTDALVRYLLKTQMAQGNWKRQSHRPPMEETDVTATFLASYYMDRYSKGDDGVKAAVDRARTWIVSAEEASQEARNFQLLAAKKFGDATERIEELRMQVVNAQRADGGWGQLEGMESDAYATGQTLFILQETGAGSESIRLAIERAVAFLLKTREADGSWHVVSRSKPIQKMFDNGDPHGTDQFISTPATAWAVAGLAATLPKVQTERVKVSFNRNIRPILSDHCFQCHGLDRHQRKAGLRLDVREEALKARKGVVAIVPGDPGSSALMGRIHSSDADEVMPPPDVDKALTTAEKSLLARWIQQGAEYEAHWAFIPPERPEPPATSQPGWVRNPVDAFILRRLDMERLSPAPEASKETLIRRVTLDLTGMPPTPGEINAFQVDESGSAYETLVDRLLRSSRYGEHLASGWLDAARYSDTNGYNNDTPRYNWRYRDWVIDAFNRNLPFDQFLTEQLAGDLLGSATLDQQIATGFNRNHNVTSEGGIIDEEYRLEYVADRVDTTATVFMALTVSCARCHDHKFDPISQKEYYEFFAFFNQVPETGYHHEHVGNPHPVVSAPTDAEREELSKVERAIATTQVIEDREQWLTEKRQIEKALPSAMVMQDMDKPRDTFLLMRGAYDKPGEKVIAAVPEVFPPMPNDVQGNRLGLARWLTQPGHPLTARVAVNRLWYQLFGTGIVETLEDFGSQGAWPTHPELLDWLATELVRLGWDRKQLLKTVIMSSTYRQHSGATEEVLARDPDNVLLAHGPRYRLAAEVIRDSALAVSGLLRERIGGPSVKPYQPAGLWSEVIVADDSYSGGAYVQGKGDELYRRSVYTWWKRTCPPPGLNTFDAPDREFCTVQRARTNTPLQALVLLNDPTYVEAGRALASRIVSESVNDTTERLRDVFRRVTGRVPKPDEMSVLLTSLQSELQRFQKDPDAARQFIAVGDSSPPVDVDPVELAAWTFLCSMLWNLDETITQH
ncbi:MAG: hypothetical protein ACI9R3_003322 [Verrucomicrobiales bacterium]|jgi:hypothetical protein